MKAFACLLAIAFLAGLGQPAFSQEATPQEPPAATPETPPEMQPETPLEIVPETPLEAAPEAPPQVQPEAPAITPEAPSEELPAPTPAPVCPVEPPQRIWPSESTHPLYIAGAVLYPVGWLLERVIVRPILLVFNHQFDETSLACPAPVLTPSPQSAARLTPASEQPRTPPRYNYQPRS